MTAIYEQRLKAMILGLLLTSAALSQQADEYYVKVAFLYNFAKFVEWPPQAFKGASDPIVLGVLGKNPFGNALPQAVAGKTLGGRVFVVREVADAQRGSGAPPC